MTLKVYNRNKKLLCTYHDGIKLPSKSQINSMQEAGYIFEVDGKKVSAKVLKELLKK